MVIIDTTLIDSADPAAGGPTVSGDDGRPRRRFHLARSKKMLVGLVLLGLFVLLAILGPVIAPHDPTALGPLQGPPLAGSAVASQQPSSVFPLGQTTIGGDILSQLLAGTRPTILVAFLAGAIATALAVIVGIAAGHIGGLVDDVLSLLANIFLVIPTLPLLIAVGALLGPDEAGNPLVVSLIIALTGWAWGARVIRAQALSIHTRDFIEAAKIIGESTWRVIISEIMPNLTAVIASSFLFTTIYAIGTYVGLGFLTVISPGRDYNWGTMLFDATSSSAVEAGEWWWYLPPGLAIALLGTALALINFGVDEYINPRLRTVIGSRAARKLVGRKLKPQLGFTPVVRRPIARHPAADPKKAS